MKQQNIFINDEDKKSKFIYIYVCVLNISYNIVHILHIYVLFKDQYKPWKSMSSSQGLFGNPSPAFGTPSYPTHLDMIRGSNASYLSNQEMNNNLLDSVTHEAKSVLVEMQPKDCNLITSKSKIYK